MRDRLGELGPTTTVVLITFTEPADLAEYQQRNALPFPLLIDADRSVYRSYGLKRGSVWRVWGAKAAKQYWQILRSDGVSGLRKPTEDTLQLGGDFVVDPSGNLAFVFRGDGPDDRPDIDQLITAIDASAN